MIVAIDIGTSTFKAALFTLDGRCKTFVETPMTIASSVDLQHETDPKQWIEAFNSLIPQLGNLNQVKALIFSGNGPTVVPVTGVPSLVSGLLQLDAAPARLWLDRRAQKEAEIVSKVMGKTIDPSFFLPKALAVKLREPKLYNKTRYFLSSSEFLAYAVTGVPCSVLPASGFDQWYWNDDALAELDLDAEKFPRFISPGDLIGSIPDAVATAYGFPSQIQVLAGGPDFFVSILGTGTVAPGRVCDRSGTSEGINLCTEAHISDARLLTYGHPVRPYWNTSGIISTSGKAIGWVKDLLHMKNASYEEFYTLAQSSRPGSGGVVFLPYLAGERAPIWDPDARGLFFNLSLTTTRAEIARAVAEGVCFAIRDVLDVMEKSGGKVNQLRVTGGPAESNFLNQLKADITGREVLLPKQAHAELLGLVIIATTALGEYASFREAAEHLVSIESVFTPNGSTSPLYDSLFATYRQLYPRVKDLFPTLQEA